MPSNETATTYRAEIRFDITAGSPEEATAMATAIMDRLQADNAELTAIFDEDWDEI